MAKLPARPSAPAAPSAASRTSIGLTPRQAAIFAYSAGWISGLLVLWLEGHDRETRRHAAQSVLGFGVLTLIGALLLGVAAVGLLNSLAVFRFGLWAAQGVVVVGLLLWAWSILRVAFGGTPRWPLIGGRADRLAEPH